jgi:hypothetical protein
MTAFNVRKAGTKIAIIKITVRGPSAKPARQIPARMIQVKIAASWPAM